MKRLLNFGVLLIALLASSAAFAQNQYPPTGNQYVRLADSPAQATLTTTTACTSAGISTSGCLTVNTNGVANVMVTVTGTYTGVTGNFALIPADGAAVATPFPLGCQPIGTVAAPVSSFTANGTWSCPVQTGQRMTITLSTISTGSVSVSAEGSSAPAPYAVDGSQRQLTGNSNRPTYLTSQTVTVPTSAGSLFAIEAPATGVVRLRYLKVCLGPTALQTTAGDRDLFLFRTTAASTGGTAQTALQADPFNDPLFGGILRTGAITTTPASPTLIANSMWTGTISLGTAVPTTAICTEFKQFDIGQFKAPLAAAGVANGLALYDVTGGAGGTGSYVIDAAWTVESN